MSDAQAHVNVHVTSMLLVHGQVSFISVSTEPCTIGFNQTMYTVKEDDSQVKVCVDMKCPENQTGFAHIEVYRDDTPVPVTRLAGKYIVVM